MCARILIIEDNPASLELAAYLLGAYGNEPLRARDGTEGLECARRERPDLILCDVRLPQMTGQEVCRILKHDSSTRHIPLVAVTAYAMVGDRELLLSEGFDGYISKPINPETFMDQVSGFLRQPQREPLPAAPPATETTNTTQAPEATVGGRFLLADNNETNAKLLRRQLEPYGYKVVTANSVREALALAREDRFDLILSDVHMPELDGFDFLKLVRADERLSSIPFILCTSSYWGESDRRRAEELGADDLIIRPADTPNIISVIQAHMKRACTGGVNRDLPKPSSPEEIPRAVKESLHIEVATQPTLPPEEFDGEHLRLVTDKLASKILELEAANEVLTEQAKGLRRQNAMLDHANVIVRDLDDRIVHWNKGAEQVYGWTKEEAIGKSASQLFQTEFPKPLEEIKSEVLRAGEWEGELAHTAKDGRRIYIKSHWILRRDPRGNPADFLEVNADITERKRAEESLRNSELRYRRLFESAKDGILILDADSGRIIDANPYLTDLLGFFKGELSGKELWEIGVFKDIAASKLAFEELRRQEYIRYEDLPLESREGLIRQVEFVSNSYLVGESRVIQCNIRDITERKHVADLLRQSEEQFRLMANSIPQLAWMAHADGFIFWYNQRWYDYTGTTPEQMEGCGWQRVHDPDVLPKVMEGWQGAIVTAEPFEMEFPLRGADGRFRRYLTRVQPLKDAHGRVVQWFGTNTDVNELKRVEESLFESEAKLSGIIESAIDAIITVNAHQRIVLFNRAAEKIFMCEAGEAIGQTLDRFLPPRFRATHQQYIEGFGETDLSTRAMAAAREISGLRSNGEEFPLEASISELQSAGEKLYTVILRDITERKRVEQQVIESREQLRSLTAHLQAIREEERTRIAREVHDVLGQLLTALKMDMSMYAKRLPESIESERLAKLKGGLKEMQELTDEIIKTVQHISSELRPGVLDTLGLVAAIEWQAREFEVRTEITCVCHLPESDMELSRDKATAMFRIFQELLTNVARHAQATRVDIEVLTENGDLSIHVRDNGRGITEEELSDTASLGLLGMHERARLFDGNIMIKGEQAKGTDIRVRMPLDKSDAVRII